MAYEFHYTPTGTGVISGKEVLEQTEDAINDLGNTAISGVQEALDKAEQALTNSENAVDDAQTALNTANTAYTAATNAQNTANAAQTTATNAQNAATAAQNDVDALENVVTGIEGRLTTTEGNVTNLTTRMGTAENNITTLQNDVVTAQATANSAQQTATTARQQSYVLRYSSTTLVASSTNSNALLDNTNNLKVGDKVIDSSGVIYSVTAIDTANSTFTIGTSLIDLAQDSDVVHKSGNETKSGELTLNDTLNTSNIIPKSNNTYECGSSSIIWKNLYSYHGYFRGGQLGDEYSSNTRTNLTLLSNRDTLDESGILFDTYRQNTAQGTGMHILGISIKENSVRYEGCRFGWYWDNSLNGYYLDFKPTTQGTYQAVKHNLGTSTDKWDTLNGLNPGSLSLPDFSNAIDISSYITVTGGSAINNNYTPPADGYISVNLGRTSGAIGLIISNGKIETCVRENTFPDNHRECGGFIPVQKNDSVVITSCLADSIIWAYFIPCQGNV